MMRDHPILRDLRAFREPKGRYREVVDALCRERQGTDYRRRLASDREIARELGIAVGTVKAMLREVGTWIDGLERLDRRSRIYCWWLHERWREVNGTDERPTDYR